MRSRSIEQILQYEFKNSDLREQALTHTSYANERTGDPRNGNERLEFLGDAILDAVISDALFRKNPGRTEGELTRLRSLIVCEKSLSDAGKSHGLNEFLLLGRGEQLGGGRHRPSIVADAVEALVGAVYLDGGFQASAAVVMRLLEQTISEAMQGILFSDYKSELQECLQRTKRGEPYYRTLSEKGPDHAKEFSVSVNLNGHTLAVGTGLSKKDAEQDAARCALESLNLRDRL